MSGSKTIPELRDAATNMAFVSCARAYLLHDKTHGYGCGPSNARMASDFSLLLPLLLFLCPVTCPEESRDAHLKLPFNRPANLERSRRVCRTTLVKQRFYKRLYQLSENSIDSSLNMASFINPRVVRGTLLVLRFIIFFS